MRCRNDYLTPEKLIALFEDFKAYNGIFYYLGSFVNYTESNFVVFKYIEAATKLDQLKEVERVCRDNDHYDPKEVKEFLLQQNLKDPRPLIHVCDRFDYVEELTHYLYQKNMFMFIEAYVQRMNSKATPPVVGALLDLNASDEQIQKLLSSVRPPVESNLWYEAAGGGGGEAQPPEDPAAVPGGARQRGQHRRARAQRAGQDLRGHQQQRHQLPHHQQVLRQRHRRSVLRVPRPAPGLHRLQARLGPVRRAAHRRLQQERLLQGRGALPGGATGPGPVGKVLVEENEFRRQLIDQVVATALPESRLPEEVSRPR